MSAASLGPVRLRSGWLEVQDVRLPESVPDLVHRLVAVAHTLAATDPLDRLAAHATGDDRAAVRLRCLNTLVRLAAGQPKTRGVIARLLDDPDDLVRRQACCVALPLLPEDAIGPALAAALIDDDTDLLRLAIPHVVRRRDDTWAPKLRELVHSNERDVALAALFALRAFPGADTEATLVRALGWAWIDFRPDVALLLGAIGTIDAVIHLHEVGADPKSSRELREATRQAIDEIQSRSGGRGAGRLSLVDTGDARGGLAVAVEPGALSTVLPTKVGH